VSAWISNKPRFGDRTDGGRRAKLSLQQQAEIRKMVSKGDKTTADAARLFKIHPATVSQLLARPSTTVFRKREYAK